MVLGYMCETHGYQRECDVAKSGERICYECGMAVTGLVGQVRSSKSSPPTDEPGVMSGDILWSVRVEYDRHFTVEAFDHESAAEAAIERVDNPQKIREVAPRNRRYGSL